MSTRETLPKSPLRFLRWFCKEALIDEIEGDLIEAYTERFELNPRKAKLKLWKEVLQSFNSRNIGIMEKYQNQSFVNSISMLKQYIMVLFRNAKKHKVYTAISLISLTLGITCASLIYLYIQKELTFDQQYDKAAQLYRINHLSETSERSYAYAPLAMTPYLVENIEAVIDGARIFKYRRALPVTVEASNRSFNEPRFAWADSNFPDLFDLRMIKGSREGILERPNVVMISEETAAKYFGDKDPMGQTLAFGSADITKLEIVGVFENFASNTSFQFDLISNLETCSDAMWSSGHLTSWANMFVSAYLQVKPGSEKEVAEAVQKATTTYFNPESSSTWISTIQPLKGIHLGDAMDIGEWSSHTDIETLYLMGAIGIIILCLGCFNFTNMITAQAGQRTKEVGVRKVLGSYRRSIAQQTLFETLIFVLAAGAVALALVYGLLPKLGTLTDHRYGISDILSPDFYGPFILTLVIVTIVSGMYPALYISRIKSLQLMNQSMAMGGNRLRNILVTAQFTMTTSLIICTGMVYLQLKYLNDKQLGFDRSVIVNIPIHNDEAVIPKINTLRSELDAYSGISGVTASSHEMLSDYTYMTNFGIAGIEENQLWERYTVEQEYIAAFGLEIVAGRAFDSQIQSDSSAFIINESAVRSLGLSNEEIIGRTITDQSLRKTGKVVGVVKDFHFRSLHHEIAPFVLYVNWDRLDYISVRLASGNFRENINHLEETWNEVFGDGVPFFFSYLDQQVAALYKKEDNQMKLFTSFSMVSILLGTLGLFGFVLFTTERKFKEIGLRKVLGATSWQVVKLINESFLKILGIAFLIAVPSTAFVMNVWLKDFAYRINQPVWIYLVALIAVILIALITVSKTTWQAASANPVDSIKNE